ncbi:MAG TPA: hypothetical protein VIE18_04815 [Gaiellaceae bacterium]|jgi:hypothetical protein
MEPPETPPDSPLTLHDVMSSPVYERLMTPATGPGEPAFPFELSLLEGGGSVRLTDFTGVRPVALVFGSYT